MTTYKEIKGVTVQTRDADPTKNVGSWATGGATGTARILPGAGGTQTAGIIFGGREGSSNTGKTEEYNGTTFAEEADLGTARTGFGGFNGTQSATFAIGGYVSSPVTNVEEWNGASWTTGTAIGAARDVGVSLGTVTAALFVGGNEPPYSTRVESWDGSSWQEIAEINTAKGHSAGSGTQPSAMIFGGGTATGATTELWNGVSWTEQNDLNTGRYGLAGAGSVYTDTIAFGGTNPSATVASTENFNGSSWTEVNDLSTARYYLGGTGTGALALAATGITATAQTTATEEWSFPSGPHLNEGDLFLSGGTALKGFGKAAGIPTATWASSGNLNQARNILDAQNGTQSSSKASGGSPPGTAGLANVEDYDGTSWSETTEMNTPRYSAAAAGANKDSALVFSGYNNTSPLASPGGYLDATEKWNGSSWTEVNELNIKMSNRSGNGTQTSALCYGGYESPYALTESWDGTNWTEVSDLNTGRMDLGGVGDSNTSALAFGGLVAPNTKSDRVETWDGTSWTEVNELNTNRAYVGGSGSKDLAIAFGGETPPLRANTEAWNGTSWTEVADLSTARKSMGSSGSAVGGLAAGGNDGSTVVTATEEFTAPTTLSTVTVS